MKVFVWKLGDFFVWSEKIGDFRWILNRFRKVWWNWNQESICAWIESQLTENIAKRTRNVIQNVENDLHVDEKIRKTSVDRSVIINHDPSKWPFSFLFHFTAVTFKRTHGFFPKFTNRKIWFIVDSTEASFILCAYSAIILLLYVKSGLMENHVTPLHSPWSFNFSLFFQIDGRHYFHYPIGCRTLFLRAACRSRLFQLFNVI